MGAITTLKQNNKPWTLTWKASGRYPIVADRIFATLADAQAYVDDISATASATGGLVLSVINDTTAKNNGVYYVKSVANTDPKYGAILDKGTLVKVGGAETEVAATYSAAVTLSNTLVVGQLIKVSGEETVDGQTYKAGFYIVNAPGSISALDTSTGASDEIGALTNRVTTLEGNRVLNTEFATYKTEVTNGLAAKADATALSTHTTDTTIHVTAEDKAKWNNAESNANAKLAEELAKLPSMYDAKGDAGKAQTAAQNYADAAVSTAVGAYAAEGVEASGLRKEIAAAEATAKSHADSVAATAKSEAITAAGTAASGLLDAYKTEVGNTYATKGEQSALEATLTGEINKKANSADVYVKGDVDSAIATAKGEAISDANAYADGLAKNYDASGSAATALADAKAYVDGIVGDVTGEDGVVTKGLNSRIEDLEAIDHDKLAADASAAAVATVLDGAPEKFDTLKEVAQWIADSESAASAADLVTRVKALEDIDHDAYKAADTALETSLKGYVDGKDTAMDTRVKALEAHDVYVKNDVDSAIADAKKAGTDANAALEAYKSVIEKSVEDAKAAAIAKAAEDAAKTLENYYTKTDVDGLVAGAKTYADGLKTAIDEVIEENERVTSEALTDLDDRVKVIEAQDVYVEATVNQAIADAKKAGTDAAAALDTYKGEASQALADNSEADQAYAKAYTDLLFASFQFASNGDIDGLFATQPEA